MDGCIEGNSCSTLVLVSATVHALRRSATDRHKYYQYNQSSSCDNGNAGLNPVSVDLAYGIKTMVAAFRPVRT